MTSVLVVGLPSALRDLASRSAGDPCKPETASSRISLITALRERRPRKSTLLRFTSPSERSRPSGIELRPGGFPRKASCPLLLSWDSPTFAPPPFAQSCVHSWEFGRSRPSFGSPLPPGLLVPPPRFRTVSTVSSARSPAGLLRPAAGPGVRRVFYERPPKLRSRLRRSGRNSRSPRRGSHPPKSSPRLQPRHITVALALLRFPPPHSHPLPVEPLPIRTFRGFPRWQYVPRLCSVDESVATHVVSDAMPPVPSMGFVPLQGSIERRRWQASHPSPVGLDARRSEAPEVPAESVRCSSCGLRHAPS